ncbi:MAG TPA: hypothetical protein VIY49_32870 [Bryobacteraceae bacterium]
MLLRRTLLPRLQGEGGEEEENILLESEDVIAVRSAQPPISIAAHNFSSFSHTYTMVDGCGRTVFNMYSMGLFVRGKPLALWCACPVPAMAVSATSGKTGANGRTPTCCSPERLWISSSD